MKHIGYGFTFEPHDPAVDWWFGSGKATQRFGASALMKGGHGWGRYLPSGEKQARGNLETMACTIYHSLDAWETLAQFLGFSDFPKNCSERFSAIIAEISSTGGSPQRSCEAIRRFGVIREDDLPFDATIQTWADYYSPNPMTQKLLDLGKQMLSKFVFGHEYIFNGPMPLAQKQANLIAALERGTVCVSMYAWRQRGSRYYKLPNDRDQHWIQLVDFKEGEYWIIRDSYTPFDKRIEWDTDFESAKLYFLDRRTDVMNPLQKMLASFTDFFQRSYTQITAPFMKQPGKEPSMLPSTPPVPQEAPQAPVPAPTAIPAGQRLYSAAYASLGKDMSPQDAAPDSLACMESLDGVYFAAFGEHLLPPSIRLSTKLGYEALLSDPRVERVDTPAVGDIVISPTGYSTRRAPHGHCGVWGKFDVMSNDSDTGKWADNYTHAGWYDTFQKTLGFPVVFFRPK